MWAVEKWLPKVSTIPDPQTCECSFIYWLILFVWLGQVLVAVCGTFVVPANHSLVAAYRLQSAGSVAA